MAKDTEKLIRQLSLISYLMAERRPVTALEIRRDVEGYSGMNEDAFARRFYADRAELESLRIQLTVERPADGAAEQENYSLRPENFHLPGDRLHRQGARGAADRADAARRRIRLRRAAAPRAAADHLGPAQPAARARPALGRARHHRVGRRPRALRAPGEDRDGDLPQQDDHVRLLHDGARRGGRPQGRPLPPALPGRPVLPRSATRTSATRSASSASRASAARSPTPPRPSTTSAARPTSTRAPTPTAPTGSSATPSATAEIRISERIAWQIERHFGRYGEIRARRGRRRRLRDAATPNAAPARLLGARAGRERARARARRARDELAERVELLAERHAATPPSSSRAPAPPRRPPARPSEARGGRRRRRARRGRDPPRALRAAGDARLILIEAGRARRAPAASPTSASACRSPTRSCARTSTSSTS